MPDNNDKTFEAYTISDEEISMNGEVVDLDTGEVSPTNTLKDNNLGQKNEEVQHEQKFHQYVESSDDTGSSSDTTAYDDRVSGKTDIESQGSSDSDDLEFNGRDLGNESDSDEYVDDELSEPEIGSETQTKEKLKNTEESFSEQADTQYGDHRYHTIKDQNNGFDVYSEQQSTLDNRSNTGSESRSSSVNYYEMTTDFDKDYGAESVASQKEQEISAQSQPLSDSGIQNDDDHYYTLKDLKKELKLEYKLRMNPYAWFDAPFNRQYPFKDIVKNVLLWPTYGVMNSVFIGYHACKTIGGLFEFGPVLVNNIVNRFTNNQYLVRGSLTRPLKNAANHALAVLGRLTVSVTQILLTPVKLISGVCRLFSTFFKSKKSYEAMKANKEQYFRQLANDAETLTTKGKLYHWYPAVFNGYTAEATQDLSMTQVFNQHSFEQYILDIEQLRTDFKNHKYTDCQDKLTEISKKIKAINQDIDNGYFADRFPKQTVNFLSTEIQALQHLLQISGQSISHHMQDDIVDSLGDVIDMLKTCASETVKFNKKPLYANRYFVGSKGKSSGIPDNTAEVKELIGDKQLKDVADNEISDDEDQDEVDQLTCHTINNKLQDISKKCKSSNLNEESKLLKKISRINDRLLTIKDQLTHSQISGLSSDSQWAISATLFDLTEWNKASLRSNNIDQSTILSDNLATLDKINTFLNPDQERVNHFNPDIFKHGFFWSDLNTSNTPRLGP